MGCVSDGGMGRYRKRIVERWVGRGRVWWVVGECDREMCVGIGRELWRDVYGEGRAGDRDG